MMFSLNTLLFCAAISLCLGAIIGIWIGRSMIPPAIQRDLQKRLHASQVDFAQYKHDVAQHFNDTSMLVNKLTEDYKAVHDHLVQGAGKLVDTEMTILPSQILKINSLE